MAETFDPLAEFKTEEFRFMDPLRKLLRFHEVFPQIPTYANAEPEVREIMRNRVLGAANTDELYSRTLGQLKQNGADSEIQNRVFNQLAHDDAKYQKWELKDKQLFRGKLVGQIDAEQGYRSQSMLGQTFSPQGAQGLPPKYTAPPAPIGPVSVEQAKQGLTADYVKQVTEDQQELQQKKQMVAQETFLEGLPPGVEWGARKIFGDTPLMGERQSAGIPVLREALAGFAGQLMNTPGEAADVAANVGYVAEQGISDFRNTSDALKRVRLEAEGKPIPPELMASKADPRVNDLKKFQEFNKNISKWGDEYLESIQLGAPQRRTTRIEEANSPVKIAEYVFGVGGDMAGFMAKVMAGQAVGGGAGAYIMTAIPSISEISQEVKRHTGGELRPELAIPVGAAIAMLEKIGVEQIGAAMTKPLKGQIQKIVIGRLVAGFEAGGVEGFTETTQQLGNIGVARTFMTPEELAAIEKVFTPDEWSQLVNSLAAGFIGGFGMTSGGGAYKDFMGERATEEEAAMFDHLRSQLGQEALEAIDNLARLQVQFGPKPSEAAAKVEEQAVEGEKKTEFREKVTDAEREYIANHPEIQNLINTAEAEEIADRLGISLEDAEDLKRQNKQATEPEAAPEEGVPSELFAQQETGGAVILDAQGNPIRMEGLKATEEEQAPAAEEAPTEEAPAEEAPARPARPAGQVGEAIDYLNANGQARAAEILTKAAAGEELTPREKAVLTSVQKLATEGQIEPEIGFIIEQARKGLQEKLDTEEKARAARFAEEEAGREEALKRVSGKADRGLVLGAIGDGYETAKEIADQTGLPVGDVRGLVNELESSGEVERRGAGSTTDPFRFITPGAQTQEEQRKAPRTREEYDAAFVDVINSGVTTMGDIMAGLRDRHNMEVTPQRAAATLRRLVAEKAIRRTTAKGVNHYRPKVARKAAEAQAAQAETAPAETQPPSPTRQRNEAQAKRYRDLLAAAGTVEEVEAVEAAWANEKSKPWWLKFEREIAAKKRLVVSEERRRAAEEKPAPKRKAAKKVAPAPSVLEQPAVQADVAQRASTAQRGVWDAAKTAGISRETAEAITEGIGEDGYTVAALAAVDENIAKALENPDVATASAVLEGAAAAYREANGEKPLRAKKRVPKQKAEPKRRRAPKEEKAPAEKAPPAAEVKAPAAGLSESATEVLAALNDGAATVSEVREKTAFTKPAVRKAFQELGRAGRVTLSRQPVEDGKGWRFVATPVAEGGEKAAKAQYKEDVKAAREEKKVAREKAKAEEKSAYERVKEEYERVTRPIEEEKKQRDRSSERGSLQLAPERQAKNDADTERTRSRWSRRGFMDFIARGGRAKYLGGLKFEFSGAMTRGQKQAWSRMIGTIEGYLKEGQADMKLLDDHLSRVTRDPNTRMRIGKVMSSFMNGEITGEQAKSILGNLLTDQALKDFTAARQRNTDRKAAILASPNIPAAIREKLAENEFYQRRAYERFLRGPKAGRWGRYKPTEADRLEAVDLITKSYAGEVQKIAERTESIQKEMPDDFDYVSFFEGFDTEQLKGVPGELADRLIGLRVQIRDMKKGLRFIEAAAGSRGGVVAVADGLRDMAAAAVEELMTDPVSSRREGSRIKINNLQARVATDVFRKLYGEIYDPAVLQRLTVEAQGTILAQAAFFEQMFEHGRGEVWAAGRNEVKGLTARLGGVGEEGKLSDDDVFRYGKLAGTYVSPEFKDFLDRKGLMQAGITDLLNLATISPNKFGQIVGGAFGKLQGFTRMMALSTVGAYVRNYLSSYLQFAMGSGDFLHPEFQTKFYKYTRQAFQAWMNDEAAMRELAEDMKHGAFHYTQTSIVSDLAPILKGLSRIPYERRDQKAIEKAVDEAIKTFYLSKNVPAKLKESYILVDYAAKKAAWETRYELAIAKGKTKAVAEQYATEHVEKFYQNADRVPEWINALSKVGAQDFAGFKYDSGRMAVNTAINAFVSIGSRKASLEGTKLHEWKGILNEHPDLMDTWQPLAGFAMARTFAIFAGAFGIGQYVFMFNTTGKLASLAGAQLMQLFGWGDDDDEVEELTTEESKAMNNIVAVYDAKAPKWEYKNTRADGTKEIRVVPLGSQFGNWAEESMIGFVQRMAIAGETPEEIAESMGGWENLAEWLPMGMTLSNFYEMATGYDPQTQSKGRGLNEIFEPGATEKKKELAAEVILNLLADSSGGLGRSWKEYQKHERRAGRTPKVGNYLKKYSDGGVDEFLEVLNPLLRPLRPIVYDKNQVLSVLPYQLRAEIMTIADYKLMMGADKRGARAFEEGATADEIAESITGSKGHKDALRELAAHIQTIKPALKWLEIDDEEVIGVMLSKKPYDGGLNRDEAKAVVRNRVEEYINSPEYYKPDPQLTADQKGETQMRVWMYQNPYQPVRAIYDALVGAGYEVEWDDAFRNRYAKIRREVVQDRNSMYPSVSP